MNLPDTARHLLAACRDGGDYARLVLADWLEEQDAARVKCERCKGRGSITFFGGPMMTPQQTGCPKCDGTGTVLDDTLAKWAEWIRASVELARIWEDDQSLRVLQLSKRTAELRAALEPVLRENCLNALVETNYDPASDAYKSSKWRYGIEWNKGLPAVVTVPTLAEAVVGAECETCGGQGQYAKPRGEPSQGSDIFSCRDCRGTGRNSRPEPSPWLRALVREWPTVGQVIPADRVPHQFQDGEAGWYQWSQWQRYNPNSPDLILDCVFNLIPRRKGKDGEDSRYHPTPDAARAALGAAVVAFGSGKVLDARSV